MEYTWFTGFIARILHFQVPKVKIQHTDIKLLFKPIGFCYDIDLFTVTFTKRGRGRGISALEAWWPTEFQDSCCYTEALFSKSKTKTKKLFNKRIALCLLLCLVCIGLLQEYFNWSCFIRIWRCDEIIRSTETCFEDMLKHQ